VVPGSPLATGTDKNKLKRKEFQDYRNQSEKYLNEGNNSVIFIERKKGSQRGMGNRSRIMKTKKKNEKEES
jgi:hypothetical protein